MTTQVSFVARRAKNDYSLLTNHMIKITHIIPNLLYGGAERLLLDICKKINKTKFEVSVVVLKNNNTLVEKFEDLGITVKVFNKKKKFDMDVINRMTEYLKETKPDIVHTHLFGGDFWGAKSAREAGIKKIVSTKHDILDEGLLRNYLARKTRKKFTGIIAISEAIRNNLIKLEKLPLEKISVIKNGIDTAKFTAEKTKIFKGDNLIIGSVGRLSKEKGHKHLIRACPFIKNRDWKLYLVGDGDMDRELQSSTRSLGIEGRVVFTGSVDDIREYLNKFDIFVLPSISEGLSLAVLEAASAGKFIIATNVGGVPEIIDDKKDGLLFTPKNIEQLVAHINWADEHREDASKMAKLLQEKVINEFDINNVIKKYEDFYIKVMR